MKRVISLVREATAAQRWMVGGAALAAMLVAVLIGLQMVSASAGARELTETLTKERRLMDAGQALLRSITAAEAGQRTYLLTGNAEAAARSTREMDLVGDHIEELSAAAADLGLPPGQPKRISDLTAERTQIIAESLSLGRAGRRAQAIALVASGRGDRLTADIEREFRSLFGGADERRTVARAQRERSQLTSLLLQIVLSLVCVVGFGVAAVTGLHGRVVAQKAAEAAEAANRELMAARHEADEANATKSRFLAAASHDMRQPLHALSLYLVSLQRRVDSPEAHRIVGAMDAAVRTMTRMFSALLDLARLEAGVLKPEAATFQMNDLLLSVADQAREVDPGRPERVRVVQTRLESVSDVDLLEVIVRNLAVNAAKYADGGRVLIGCRRKGRDIEIQIHDEGPGIPEDQLKRIFGEFVRGEATRSVEGLGLGLSIVDRLARLLGHKVSVRSVPGKGTVFSVTVPRTRGRSIEADGEGGEGQIVGKRILLVDDEPLVLDAMSGALTDAGAVVTTAGTAAGAIEAARAGVDLCILDLYLAGENGIDVLARIESDLGHRVRCMFVTGSTASEALQSLRASGRRWATKPVSVHDLIGLAAEILARPA